MIFCTASFMCKTLMKKRTPKVVLIFLIDERDLIFRIFTIFWVLSMYDISVPKTTYERELQRVRRSLALVVENAEIVRN